MNRIRITRAALCLTSLLAVSCGEGESFEVRTPAEEDYQEPEALRQLRSRQLIRFTDSRLPEGEQDVVAEYRPVPVVAIPSTNSGTLNPDVLLRYAYTEGSPLSDLSLAAFGECAHAKWRTENGITGPHTPGPGQRYSCGESTVGGACRLFGCLLEQFVCMENRLLEIASSTSTITMTSWPDAPEDGPDGTLEVPPQTAEARAALRETAAFYGSYFSIIYSSIPRHPVLNPGTFAACGDVVRPEEAPGITAAHDLAAVFREQLKLTRETTEVVSRDYVALADAEFSRHTSRLEAMEASRTIRLHAAHLLTGGLVIEGFSPGTCNVPNRLSAREQSALGILRTVALKPSDLAIAANDAQLINLIEGDLPGTSGRGVRPRLARIWQDDELAEMPVPQLLARLDLSLEDFEAARNYLVQEHSAFHRSDSRTMPGFEIPGTPMGEDAARYASTGTAPTAPPWTSSASASRSVPGPAVLPQTLYPVLLGTVLSDVRTPTHLATTGSAPALLWGRASINGWVQLLDQVNGSLADPLRELLTELDAEFEGVLVVGSAPASTTLDVTIATHESPARFILVTSTDAVRCATEGAIEGQACTWTDVAPVAVEGTAIVGNAMNAKARVVATLNQASPTLVPTSPSTPAGFEARVEDVVRAATWPNAVTWEIPSSTPVVHVLKRREGALDRLPGSYEPFSAAAIWPDPTPDPTLGYFDIIPIAQDVDKQAAAILSANPGACGEPLVSCAGVIGDARLPLENEINEDGSQYENSWYSYLNAADLAASQADELGEESIRAYLDIDERSEAAVEDIEDICGVNVDIDPIQSVLDGGVTNPLEAITDPDLRMCLSPDANVTVSLGNNDLCAWRPWIDDDAMDPNNPLREGALCARADGAPEPSLQCPRVRTAAEAVSGCELPGTAQQYKAVPITDHLGFFVPNPTEPGGGERRPEASTCDAIRELRAWAGAPAPIEQARVSELWRIAFRDDDFFETENVNSVAMSIRWEASIGNYSTLYVNDIPFLTNGSMWEGHSSEGICNVFQWPVDGIACPLGVNRTDPAAVEQMPLMCAKYLCLNPSQLQGASARSVMNARLARAATVARWLGGATLDGFVVPDRHHIQNDNNANLDTPHTMMGYTLQNYEGEGGAAAGISAPRAYCPIAFDEHTSPLNIGPRLWAWDITTLDHDEFPLCEKDRTIRFTTLSGERPYGEGRVREDTVTAHRIRADLFLRRLRQNEPNVGDLDSITSVDENPLNLLFVRLGSERARAIYTRCENHAECRDKVNPRPYPWDEATDTPNTLVKATERVGVSAYTWPFRGDMLTDTALFDALELLCESGNAHRRIQGLDPMSVTAESQIPIAAAQIEDAADALRSLGARVVLEDMPIDIVEAIRRDNTTTPSTLGGQYGTELSLIRASLAELAAAPAEIQDATLGVARAFRVVNAQLTRLDLERDVQRTSMISSVTSHGLQCASALLDAVAQNINGGPAGVASAGPNMAAAALQCVDHVQQSIAEMRIYGLQGRIKTQDEILAIAGFESSLSHEQAKLRAAATRLESSSNQLRASLTQLEAIRARGRRALSSALFLDSDDAGRVFRTNTLLRRRLNTTQQRYEDARARAIRYAFLAKRAVEQRFGVRLADLDEQMTLVEAPATWEASLCTLDGIDVERIRNQDESAQTYSSGYIGDYVQKLRDFVASYSTDHPFTNAEDTAVVSVRDDIANVRDRCMRPSGNRLYFSNDPSVLLDTTGVGWSRYDCAMSPSGVAYPNCTNVQKIRAVYTVPVLDGSGQPVLGENNVALVNTYPDVPVAMSLSAGSPDPMRVTFGPLTGACGTGCGWQAGVRHGQDAPIGSGVYRLSWYGRTVGGAGAVGVTLDSGQTFGAGQLGTVSSENANHTWKRYWVVFDSYTPQNARVIIRPASETAGAYVDIAGLALEKIADLGNLRDAITVPSSVESTGATLESEMIACEDTDGDVFRRRLWRRACARLCNSGFGGACGPTESSEYCYWETTFTLSEQAIDRGEMLVASGFARGNYNYRIESIGVNFVGTGARTCADPEQPSTCYSAGFIPYTLVHNGPHYVRNTFGETYHAQLFPGVMEHARGLASERYLTNPVSSADNALIGPYVQRSLRGRPLDGTYTIRVWDEPGVNFSGIEDVQILLNYRYWTRSR